MNMSRPQRNRRLSRRVWSPEHDVHHVRPVKRLFTPEIKRMLKDWLIRRRENPYPSRDEKKRLAMETGLTYTQICNWFANWRRKLKNSENERLKNSWGTLIKNYNTNARGNVEQFSISSEDSIWEEEFNDNGGDDDDNLSGEDDFRHNYKIIPRKRTLLNKKIQPLRKKLNYEHRYYLNKPKYCSETIKMTRKNYFSNNTDNDDNENNVGLTAQCFQISSTTTPVDARPPQDDDFSTNLMSTNVQENKTKYKQKMMEKYLRDTYAQDQKLENTNLDVETKPTITGAAELSKKWLDSATKFTPNKNNYFVEWNSRSKQFKSGRNGITNSSEHINSMSNAYTAIHHKDELDAAEALANLAYNCRQRMLESHSTVTKSAINVISS